MLPTIDISLIGVIVAIWNVVKVIWDYTSKAFMWIMHQALALLIGSKLWATAAFLAVALVVIHYLSVFLSFAAGQLFSLVSQSASLNDDSLFSIVDFFVDTDALLSVVTYCVSCWTVYRLVISMDFTRRAIQRTFTLLSRSWKT